MFENFSLLIELLNDLVVVEITYEDEELLNFVLDTIPPSWKVFGSILSLTSHENIPTLF